MAYYSTGVLVENDWEKEFRSSIRPWVRQYRDANPWFPLFRNKTTQGLPHLVLQIVLQTALEEPAVL